ncbi:hypothetical protein DFJ63DRAFT_329450 [Scheffersomyces coipomensis]|uniref:uncharacterized protein n=1 Tax=Scheffersomyces coipomensis TaxID=1788519 RepID=UPI00315C6EF9
MFQIIDPHTIDLGTLDEIRDPNFINRYPPLYKRKPNLVSIVRRHNNHNSLDSTNVDDILNHPFDNISLLRSLTPIPPLLHSDSEQSNNELNDKRIGFKKRHIIKNLFKMFTLKRSKAITLKPTITHVTSDFNRSALINSTTHHSTSTSTPTDPNLSIVSETSSHYLDTFYPTNLKPSFTIKQDSPETILTTRSRLDIRSEGSRSARLLNIFPPSPTNAIIQSPTSLHSPINSIVIPPINPEFQNSNNPWDYTNTIVHPNLDRSPELNGINYNSDLRRRIIEPSQIPFSHFDFYNINSGGLSPIEDDMNHIDDELQDSDDYTDAESYSGSNGSYYSFTKSPNEYLLTVPKSPVSFLISGTKSQPRSKVIRRT